MSATNGSISLPISPDLTKEVVSYVVAIPAGAGVAQVINPAVNVQSMTAYNYTTNLLRATVTFAAGVTAAGVAATRTFLIPPAATATVDFADHDGDNAVGSIDVIDSVSIVAVVGGVVTTESSALAVATAAIAGLAYVNFASA